MYIWKKTTLHSLTWKYRGLQGNPCNENRDPAMRTGIPCNENRFFPVGIALQGSGLQCVVAANHAVQDVPTEVSVKQ